MQVLPLYLSFIHFTLPTQTHHYLFHSCCTLFFLSESLFISPLHILFVASISLLYHSVPWYLPLLIFSLIYFHNFFTPFPSVSLFCLYHSLPFLFYSLYLCLPLCPSLPPLAAPCFYPIWHTLSLFSLKLSFPLSLPFTPLPLISAPWSTPCGNLWSILSHTALYEPCTTL